MNARHTQTTLTRWLLVVMGILAFFAYAWFPYVTSQPRSIFPSPDATANFFWIEHFARHGKLWYADYYNTIADGIVVPRSVTVAAGMVKPMSFLGIILIYGTLAKLTGTYAVLFFTPALAVIGVWCLYGIVRRVFDRRVALISAFMAFTLAPYWYFASRGLMHNVAFTALALAGAWLGLVARERIRTAYHDQPARFMPHFSATVVLPLGAGLLFGTALLTRTSEAPWLGMVMGIFILMLAWPTTHDGRWYRHIPWAAPLALAAGVGIMLAVLLYFNTQLYGAPLDFGYPSRLNTLIASVHPTVTKTVVATTPAKPWWNVALEVLFPFSIDLHDTARRVWYYYADMFWYLFWPAAAGIAWLVARLRHTPRRQWLYLLAWLGVSGYMALLYGSWNIHDNPSGAITIGNSYTRYWLPMYLLALPFAAITLTMVADGIGWILQRLGARQTWSAGVASAFIAIGALAAMGMSSYQALYGHEEGLVYMKRANAADRPTAAHALALTDPRGVVISERFDKFFFPRRRVVVGTLTDNAYNQQYARLVAAGIPIYYYGFTFPPRDLNYLNGRKLAEVGLHIEMVKTFDSGVTLYQLRATKE